MLCLEEIRKHAAKWYYRDEWGRSIEESHPEGAERAALVEGFWKEVGMIGRALAPVLPALQAWNGAASERETRVQWFH